MDVFALSYRDPTPYTLTERVYFEKTKRVKPYVGETQKGTTLYLAVCPDCKNPIEIRNIGSASEVNKNIPLAPYGQHYLGQFGNLPALRDDAAYQNCSLRGIPGIASNKVRTNEVLSLHILIGLVENAAAIRDILSDIYGVAVGPTLFKRAVTHFIERQCHRCCGVQINNLPYALAYWADSQSLFGQVLTETSPLSEVSDRLTSYTLENGKVESRKEVSGRDRRYRPDLRVHCLPLKPNSTDQQARIGRIEVLYDEYGMLAHGKRLLSREYVYQLDSFATHAEKLNQQDASSAQERQNKWRKLVLEILQEKAPKLFKQLGQLL